MTLLRELKRRVIDALYVLVVGLTRTQLLEMRLQREMWERFLRDVDPVASVDRRRESDRAVN